MDVPAPISAPVDFDGIEYGYECDLVAPAVVVPCFDLTPTGGIVLDCLYAPTGTCVLSASTAGLIARHVCRVFDASLVSTSAEHFASDAHGLC